MNGHACREMLDDLDWMSDPVFSDEWEPAPASARRTPQPAKTYSKRSAHLADLRMRSEWANANADGYTRAPSEKALSGAKGFINNLPDACLDFRLGLSQDGEINFFFGDAPDLFQILIDESGLLSYYAKVGADELAGSDLEPHMFQYLKILRFVDRNK